MVGVPHGGRPTGAGAKGGAAAGEPTTVRIADKPHPRGLLPREQNDILFQPDSSAVASAKEEGWPEARKVWRVREPDFPGCRTCGCALPRINVA